MKMRTVSPVKKSEWIYLARNMWAFADTNEGKLSPLIKELIYCINQNMEVIVDDLGEDE